MVSIPSIFKSVGNATLANLVGRAANVTIALSIITVFGADAFTDQFFFIMAVGFFFFGILANAITEATIPLILSGHINPTSSGMGLLGAGCSTVILLAALIGHLFFNLASLPYVLALGLLSGAGIANGFATGANYAAERFRLPGLTWSFRMIPLAAFFLFSRHSDHLAWLAIGIGLVDWMRFLIIGRRAESRGRAGPWHGLAHLRDAFPTYGKVVAASLIMGLNPIIDRTIAQLSGTGAISILETGERFYMMLSVLSTIGITTVLLTHLSKDAVRHRLAENWLKLLRMAVVWNLFWLLVGLAWGLWGLAWYLHHLATLTPAQSHSAQWVYWCYLAGLPPFGFGVIYVKRLQAQHRWWVMVVTAVFSTTLNIPLSLALRHWLGVPGIALATTLIAYLTLAILAVAVHGKSGATIQPTD